MKILLIIDHFGSGGAQRQIVALACGLKKSGHNVEIFVYFPQHSFFRSRIDDCGIVVHEFAKGSRFSLGVIRRLGSLFKSGDYTAAISYLKSANIYAELAKLVYGGPPLIVSERTSYHDDTSFLSSFARTSMHRLADFVVANSVTQTNWLRSKAWLRDKVACIYNGLDPATFAAEKSITMRPEGLRLLGIGRIGPEKNLLALIEGLNVFFQKFGYVPEINWVGPRDASEAGKSYCEKLDNRLDELPHVRKQWHWLGTRDDVPKLLVDHHALIHPSLYEGLPNAVLEALASGTPVLVSNVCDHPLLVEDGVRGFLFDPLDPAGIAAAIQSLASLDIAGWNTLSENAREYARADLTTGNMVSKYERLLVKLVPSYAVSNA